MKIRIFLLVAIQNLIIFLTSIGFKLHNNIINGGK